MSSVLGLALIAFLVLSCSGRKVKQPDATPAAAEPEIVWNREYDLGYDEAPQSIAGMDDGGLIVALTERTGGCIMGTDSTGKQRWTRYFRDSIRVQLHGIERLPNGQYVAWGIKKNDLVRPDSACIVAMAADGKTLWLKTHVLYGHNSYGVWASDSRLVGILLKPDGTLALLIDAKFDYVAVRFTEDGVLLPSQRLKKDPALLTRVAVRGVNGQHYFVGTKVLKTVGLEHHPFVAQFDPATLESDSIYTSSADLSVFRVVPADGGFLVIGKTRDDKRILRLQPNGDVLWTRTLGRSGGPLPAVAMLPNGHAVVLTFEHGGLHDDLTLSRFSYDGVERRYTFQSQDKEAFAVVTVLNATELVFAVCLDRQKAGPQIPEDMPRDLAIWKVRIGGWGN